MPPGRLLPLFEKTDCASGPGDESQSVSAHRNQKSPAENAKFAEGEMRTRKRRNPNSFAIALATNSPLSRRRPMRKFAECRKGKGHGSRRRDRIEICPRGISCSSIRSRCANGWRRNARRRWRAWNESARDGTTLSAKTSRHSLAGGRASLARCSARRGRWRHRFAIARRLCTRWRWRCGAVSKMHIALICE